MSSITRNSFTLFYPDAGIVCAQIVQSGSGATVALANQSGDRIQQDDVSLTRNSAGNYTIAIQNFMGPQGRYSVSATVNTTTQSVQISAQVGAVAYSGRTLSVDLLSTITGAAADCGLFFEIKAF